MGLRVRKSLGVRVDTKEREINKKFVFAFEGEKTESQYFTGIENSRVELGIKDLICIEQLERNDPSRSNQLMVVKEVNLYLNNIISCQECCDDIKTHLEAIVGNYQVELKKEVLSLINNSFPDNDYEKNIKNFIEKLNKLLNDNLSNEELMQNIKDFNHDLEYEKDFDIVCIIIDRDRKSFTEQQYDEVLKICNENNYRLGLTNPCFEFWLLLHFTDMKEYNLKDIFDNKRATKNAKTFLEKCLIEKIDSYNKNRLRFSMFKENIKTAVENEKFHCNDLSGLKNELGSSVGKIISQLLD